MTKYLSKSNPIIGFQIVPGFLIATTDREKERNIYLEMQGGYELTENGNTIMVLSWDNYGAIIRIIRNTDDIDDRIKKISRILKNCDGVSDHQRHRLEREELRYYKDASFTHLKRIFY